MMKPTNNNEGDIVALDRADIDYAKFEEITSRGVIYVSKMKKNLVYNSLSDIMYIAPNGLMQERVQIVEFTKHTKGTGEIKHKARINTYVDLKKKNPKLISLLTNDMDMPSEEIIAIY